MAVEKHKHLATYRYWGPNEARRTRSMVVNDETALWAARICVGEGGAGCSADKASAMLWAIANRWFLHPASKRYWPSYLYLMRRFSQPINPRLQKGGDLARKYASTKHCTPARLRRLARISSLTREDIPERIADFVERFQAGTLPPPASVLKLKRPRVSNWASHRGLSRKYPWGIAFSRKKNPDWFFEDARLIKGSVVVDFYRRDLGNANNSNGGGDL